MTELLDLCYDVLIRILEEINPEDVAACAQTSHGFNEFIKSSTRLYKAQYLRNFVCPRLACCVHFLVLMGFRMIHEDDQLIRSQHGSQSCRN